MFWANFLTQSPAPSPILLLHSPWPVKHCLSHQAASVLVLIYHKEKYIRLPALAGLQQPKGFSCFHLPAASPEKREWRDCLHLSTALKSFMPPLSFCWIDTVPGSQCLWAPACFQAWQWWITYNHKLGTNQLSICLFQTSCFSFCIIEVPMPCFRMPTA